MTPHLFPRKFRRDPRRAYLDWASAAPVHPAAARAFAEALSFFGNPSSPHEEGRAAKELLEAARTRIARLAGVKQRAVVFTSGATEANNLSIRGRIERCRAQHIPYEKMHVLYLPTMHASSLGSVEEVGRLGVRTEAIRLSGYGIDLRAFERQLTAETVLVCLDAVCGETGVRFDTLKLRRALDAAGMKRCALHVDASQLPLVEPIEHTRLGADLLVLDAQKAGGVRGIGALVVPDARLLSPVTQGGGQEEGLRPGTEPVALAAAFAAALEARAEGCEQFSLRAREARAQLIAGITENLKDSSRAVMHEHPRASNQTPHILNISLPGLDTDYLVTLLDTDGFSVSTRSACEADAEDGSKAVLAYTGDEALSKATLRISWGPETPLADLRRFAAHLPRITSFLAG